MTSPDDVPQATRVVAKSNVPIVRMGKASTVLMPSTSHFGSRKDASALPFHGRCRSLTLSLHASVEDGFRYGPDARGLRRSARTGIIRSACASGRRSGHLRGRCPAWPRSSSSPSPCPSRTRSRTSTPLPRPSCLRYQSRCSSTPCRPARSNRSRCWPPRRSSAYFRQRWFRSRFRCQFRCQFPSLCQFRSPFPSPRQYPRRSPPPYCCSSRRPSRLLTRCWWSRWWLST